MSTTYGVVRTFGHLELAQLSDGAAVSVIDEHTDAVVLFEPGYGDAESRLTVRHSMIAGGFLAARVGLSQIDKIVEPLLDGLAVRMGKAPQLRGVPSTASEAEPGLTR